MVKLTISFNSVVAILFFGSLILYIFKYFNGTLINKLFKFFTCILNDDISRYFNLVHPLKRESKSVTKEVLKLDKSIDSNELQLENISFISVTECV